MSNEYVEAKLPEAVDAYVEKCFRTFTTPESVLQTLYSNPELYAQLSHLNFGMMTELGEIIDVFKRHMFYGVPINVTRLIEEAGDFCFYFMLLLQVAREATNDDRITLENILKVNNDKLAARYPEGFSKNKAVNRDTDNEEAVMEATLNGKS